MTAEPAETTGVGDHVGRTAIRRISWRLMPFLLVGFLIAYIDRSDVGFAAFDEAAID